MTQIITPENLFKLVDERDRLREVLANLTELVDIDWTDESVDGSWAEKVMKAIKDSKEVLAEAKNER